MYQNHTKHSKSLKKNLMVPIGLQWASKNTKKCSKKRIFGFFNFKRKNMKKCSLKGSQKFFEHKRHIGDSKFKFSCKSEHLNFLRVKMSKKVRIWPYMGKKSFKNFKISTSRGKVYFFSRKKILCIKTLPNALNRSKKSEDSNRPGAGLESRPVVQP